MCVGVCGCVWVCVCVCVCVCVLVGSGEGGAVAKKRQGGFDVRVWWSDRCVGNSNQSKSFIIGPQICATYLGLLHDLFPLRSSFRSILAKDIDIKSVQLSIIVVNPSLIITVQEGKYPVSIFNAIWRPVLNRLNVDRSRIRKSGTATQRGERWWVGTQVCCKAR